MRPVARGLGLFLAVALSASPSGGQQQAPPVKADETSLALGYLVGRYRTPVTCTLRDGSIVQREEAIVFRPGPQKSGRLTVRATFFGVDVADAERCYNVVSPRVPDRRGSLTLGYEGLRRTDLGMHDLRLELKRGMLDFSVLDGRLEIRPFAGDEPPRSVDLEPGNPVFSMRPIPPNSDGHRLLAPLVAASAGAERRPRQFEFRIEGAEGFPWSGFFIEDVSRAR